MQNKTITAVLALNLFLSCGVGRAWSAEILVDNAQNAGMAISIYNNNLGFVKDTRNINLSEGNHSIAFEGVAATMKPETAMILGDDIVVVEQNYDYDLLTPENLLEKSVGDVVKTAVFDAEKGQDIFSRAKILSNSSGRPVLEFDYGVETNFPGRLIYEKIPEGLRVKPTLTVNMNSETAGEKKLELGYLVQGISWRADYIAEVTGKNVLDLNTWITLNNATGADYTDATVQLVSGSVNQTFSPAVGGVRPMMMQRKSVMADGMDAVNAVSAVPRSNLGDYYLYTLPVKTTIKDKQSKQVSLMTQKNVAFEKEYKMISPLYMGINSRVNEFTKLNPNVVFKFNNEKESNLGVPMPAGIVRFYQNDDKGNLQFIGESKIEQSAVGEKIELTIGRAFDVFAKGKIVSVERIARDISDITAEITFKNVTNDSKKLIFEQEMDESWTVLAENVKSAVKNADTAKWLIEIPANDEFVLTYKVRLSRNN